MPYCGTKCEIGEQFGVFYPLGPVVLALQSHDDAERIRQLLIDGGYDERDVTLAESAQVAQGARELLQSASIIAKLFGAELDAMHKHIELADAGDTFLIAYSPSDLDTKRLMNVARRFRIADGGRPCTRKPWKAFSRHHTSSRRQCQVRY
jgi:hypothetical protein